ncbi:MAG: hypothetical protein IKY02_03755 [Lachnospiraceae bacterium]|nr:hypothetical protein [Lachnospiraceae bacterium]
MNENAVADPGGLPRKEAGAKLPEDRCPASEDTDTTYNDRCSFGQRSL